MIPVRRRTSGTRLASAVVGCVLAAGAWTPAAAQAPQVTAPQPTVPEVFTIMGQFVRVAYNQEGFVTLGYEMAQRAIGEEWLMLEAGLTMRSPAKNYTLKREHLTLKTPDGTMIPLATQSDYAKAGYLSALNNRAKVIRDSINYFPVDVTRGCALSFFGNVDSRRVLAFDEVELSSTRACVGRLYFHVPGGIKVGQHWLFVDFGPSGKVEVPFRILTKEEEKQFRETWQDIKKAHDSSYAPAKKEKQ